MTSLVYPPNTLEIWGRRSRTLRGKINSNKIKLPRICDNPAHAPRSLPMDNQGYQGKPIGRSG